MARLTACFALSAVLLLATGICSGTGQPTVCLQAAAGLLPALPPKLPSLPPTTLPTPKRIIIKANTSLSITVRADDNTVVLAETRSQPDPAQLWYQYFPPPVGKEFVLLVSTGTSGLWAMEIPEKRKVKLVPFINPTSVSSSIKWTQDNALDNGFYKIRSVNKTDLVLDGLLDSGPIRDGTDVGAISEEHAKDNVLWKIENFLCKP